MRAKEMCQWSTARSSTTAILCYCHHSDNDERAVHCPIQLCSTCPASPSSRSWTQAESLFARLPGHWSSDVNTHREFLKPLYKPQMSFKTSNLALAFSSIPAHIWAGFSSHFLLLYSCHLPTRHSDMEHSVPATSVTRGENSIVEVYLFSIRKMPKHDWHVGGQMLVHKYLQLIMCPVGRFGLLGCYFFCLKAMLFSNIFQYALHLH